MKNIENNIKTLLNLFNAGKYDLVLTKSKKLIREFPQYLVLYNILGSSYQNMGNLSLAKEIFEKGLKLDASIHAFSCPLAPSRIQERIPNAKFILCLREPVSRSFSHWNMVLNTKEAVANDVDWSTFEKAWTDNRLRDDSNYGTSMNRWLKEFDLEEKHRDG